MRSSLINKNIIILTLALIVTLAINAQEVRVIDNKGTLEIIRNNQVTTAAVAPVDPLEGDVWFDTSGTTSVTKTFDGTNWVSNSVNVYNGFFIVNGSGVTTVSAIPFQPSQVSFVAHANVESLNLNTDNGVGNNARGISNSFGTMNGFVRLNNDSSITQQVIYVGGHGNSINDISRFASSSNCLGLRYGDQNGTNLGVISGAFTGFTPDGFTINVTYTNGVLTASSTNPVVNIQPADVQNEDVVVLFTAYK
ncbi:hypothetical protein [Algibacter sp. R77976]|uniref:hypothetical protein n=1 Tax=Algibacter sp. R77976 TaxID=3093873 RepID=UPI0037CBE6F5